MCSFLCVYVNSTSSVTHAAVLFGVLEATDVSGDVFQFRVNSHRSTLPHLRAAWLLSANSWFWGIKRAMSRMRSATTLIKNRLCCTFALHFPKALMISAVLTDGQGTSSRGIFSMTLWQAALNSLRLCLPAVLHIYYTNNPQLNWHLQFFLSGYIMLSNDKWVM